MSRFKTTRHDVYSNRLLDPGSCSVCGADLSVCWIVIEASKDSPGIGEVWKRRCDGCERVFGHKSPIPWENSNAFLVVTVDALGGVSIWQRPGSALMPETGYRYDRLTHVLGDRVSYLAGLHEARKRERVKPGKWRLQLRDDGLLWAPWAIGSRRKDGAPWPFRRSTLRKLTYRRRSLSVDSRGVGIYVGDPVVVDREDRRSCSCCRAKLTAGDEVVRPDVAHWDRVDYRGRFGWSASMLRDTLVCSICAGKAERGFVSTKLRLVRS